MQPTWNLDKNMFVASSFFVPCVCHRFDNFFVSCRRACVGNRETRILALPFPNKFYRQYRKKSIIERRFFRAVLVTANCLEFVHQITVKLFSHPFDMRCFMSSSFVFCLLGLLYLCVYVFLFLFLFSHVFFSTCARVCMCVILFCVYGVLHAGSSP